MPYSLKLLKKLWVLSGLCFFFVPTYAQINSGLVLPSPNNRFLGNTVAIAASSNVGVDLYTGALSANVPVCQLVSKELTIPVSLTYIGGKGIKVQDYASQAGLGWLLSAGGSVTRVVRAFPDENSNGYLGTGHAGQQVAAWKLNSAALPGSFNTTPPTSDGEPDIYFIKTPSFSFQFTFDENGNVVVSNNSGVKIISKNIYNTANGQTSFEAIDENGTHYYFGSTASAIEYTNATIYGNSLTFPTTWYLDKIATFNSKDVVTFEYTAAPGNDVLSHYVGVVTWDIFGNTNYDTTTPITTTLVPPKYLSRIVGVNSKLDFSYAFDRLDDPSAARLVSITQSSVIPIQDAILNKYTFNHSYFGTPSTDKNLLRLRLDSVRVTGNTSTTATPITLHAFTYNLDRPISNRKSFAEVDLWGYQNFYLPKAFTPFPGNNRDPDLTGTQLGVLTAVKELYGGSWNVTYELNDFNNNGTNKAVGGLRVKRLAQTMPSGENLYRDYSYVNAGNISTGQIFSPSYAIIGYVWSNGIRQALSECPSEVYDLNGNFVGYSSVKVTEKNGGYTVSSFSNFSDFPDILNYLDPVQQGQVPDVTSSTSYAFKRGLPLNVTVYNSAGDKISEDLTPLTAYTMLTNPAGKKSWGYKWNTVSYNVGGASGYNSYNSVYFTPYENYQLTQAVHKEYDQLHPANFVQTTTTFGFSPANLRQVKTITTTDAKGKSYVKTFYRPQDTDIPRLAAGEQAVVTSLANANNVNAVIHETDNRNGTIKEMHNTYTSIAMGTGQNTYMTQSDLYMGGAVVKQKLFKYDPGTSNLSSEKVSGGKATTYQYGYGNALPVAVIDNAEDAFSVSSQMATQYGALSLTNNQYTTTFTNDAAGSMIFTINASPGETYSIYYNLTGPSNASGTLCASRSSATCSYPESVTLNNMPVGTYTLSISSAGGNASYKGMGYTYNYLKPTVTTSRGFFYEGFEEYMGGAKIIGSAHGGQIYYSDIQYGPYNLSFPLPDARKYYLQYWLWQNGKWVMKQQPYTGPVVLPGIIDDVRVFPADALLTTFNYSAQVGKSSEIDPAGKTTSYEYDGLGRLSIVRDNDRNIISKTCVNYYGGTGACPDNPVYTNTLYTRTFSRNNCPAGYAPGDVVYTVAAGKYSSTISQEDANQQAANEAQVNGQANANTNGTCSLIYYSVAKSADFTRNNCGVGFIGTVVTYTVQAGRYTSLISQADADQKATNDVAANGQSYANTNGYCNSTQVLKYGSLTGTSVTFTTSIPGDINLTLSGEPLYYYSLYYTLSGPSSTSGNLCVTRTSYNCSYPSSVTLSNMPAGTYTLTVGSRSGTSPTKPLGYSYWGAP
jgi:YD repeat-containing protein